MGGGIEYRDAGELQEKWLMGKGDGCARGSCCAKIPHWQDDGGSTREGEIYCTVETEKKSTTGHRLCGVPLVNEVINISERPAGVVVAMYRTNDDVVTVREPLVLVGEARDSESR